MEKFHQAVAELLTVRDLARFGMTLFNTESLWFGHGTDNAWDDALALIRFALHLPIDYNDAQLLDCRLISSERQRIVDLFKQRVEECIPVPYLTNQALFARLIFYVDERVLIPRSPIAELIEQGFNPWVDENQVQSILDMCTGSGCIAVTCALAFPQAQVDAVDISEDALIVAQKNVELHQADNVRLIESDVFDSMQANQQYDIIVSNPPYVSDDEMAILPQEFSHEPDLALRAKDEGLAIVERLLKQSAGYLSEQGVLVVEVGNSQYALQDKYPQVPFYWLEFAFGGDGVFVLTREQLVTYFGE